MPITSVCLFLAFPADFSGSSQAASCIIRRSRCHRRRGRVGFIGACTRAWAAGVELVVGCSVAPRRRHHIDLPPATASIPLPSAVMTGGALLFFSSLLVSVSGGLFTKTTSEWEHYHDHEALLDKLLEIVQKCPQVR
ncbi:hypothetical protein Y032_0152g2852 [Ancylostoma ceylanicum]|uniref:Nematode cuticle collagen N-terminal domain-containing protein n=1 Tax=Ancylostoma ceylanicum TaxID=53326 RepID=A0A016T0L6_9BILA|nr:hypothetical protein Y032_0152g2852 [Ancylostoma ceylanicum]